MQTTGLKVSPPSLTKDCLSILCLLYEMNVSTHYWTVSKGKANHTGHTCRECRGTIFANEPICVRDGRKIRLFYHEKCYSGDADPRTQGCSSYYDKTLQISDRAPIVKGRGKWWTSEYGYRGHVLAPAPMNRGPLRAGEPSAALRRPSAIIADALSGKKLVVEYRKEMASSSSVQNPRVQDIDSCRGFEQNLQTLDGSVKSSSLKDSPVGKSSSEPMPIRERMRNARPARTFP